MQGTRISFWAVLCFMIGTFCMQFYFVYVNHYDRFQYVDNGLKDKSVHHIPPDDAHPERVPESEISKKNETLKALSQNKIMKIDDSPNKIGPRKPLTSRDLFNLVRKQNKDKLNPNENGVAEAVAALKSRFAERKTAPVLHVPDVNEDPISEESSDTGFMQAGKNNKHHQNPAQNPIFNAGMGINQQGFREGKVAAKAVLNERINFVIKLTTPCPTTKPPQKAQVLVKDIPSDPIDKQRSPLVEYSYQRRLDSHDYQYIIKPKACLNQNGKFRRLQLLILVASSPTNYNLREVVRRTWGMTQYPDFHKDIVEAVFMLGSPEDPDVLTSIQDESRLHGDILMEDFKDTYLNLTVKTVMGLKWATRYCPSTKFVMKTDDDMMVNTPHLLTELKTTSWINYIGGKVALNYPVIRDPDEKFFVPYEVYDDDTYPPYVVGIGYIISIDLVHKLYMAALTTPLFPWEDVYIGMLMEKVAIKARPIKDFHKGRFHDSEGRLILTHTMLAELRKTSVIHDLTIDMMLGVWGIWSETL